MFKLYSQIRVVSGKSSCCLMAKECTPSTCKFPLGGFLGKSLVRITDRPDVYVKQQTKLKQSEVHLKQSKAYYGVNYRLKANK